MVSFVRMFPDLRRWAFALLFLWAGLPHPAAAQPFEQLGVRALGMGGAFVAVADDATAIYWNPAGFATGDYFRGLVERQQTTFDAAAPTPRRGSATLVAFGMPALGLGYYRLASTVVTGRGASSIPSHGAVHIQTDNFGVTLLQSLGDYLVVGTTLRAGQMEAARVSAAVGQSARELADQADRAQRSSAALFDADVGVMAKFGNVRLATTWRNLRSPSLSVGLGAPVRLERQGRAGLAWLPTDRWLLAADVDLKHERVIERQQAAFGVQRFVSGRRVAIRGGTRFSLRGDAAPSWSIGTSVPIRSGTWIDGQLTRGSRAADHTWGVSARVGY